MLFFDVISMKGKSNTAKHTKYVEIFGDVAKWVVTSPYGPLMALSAGIFPRAVYSSAWTMVSVKFA